jgi:hypothetical protein
LCLIKDVSSNLTKSSEKLLASWSVMEQMSIPRIVMAGPHTGALPVFTRAEALFRDIVIQHRIEGVVVEGTAQSEHGIAIFFKPPSPGALQPNVTDVFVG